MSLLKGYLTASFHYHPLNFHNAPTFLLELLTKQMPTLDNLLSLRQI